MNTFFCFLGFFFVVVAELFCSPIFLDNVLNVIRTVL
jgi:hypothetical protein